VNQLREFFSESSKRAAGALSARLDRPDDGPPLAGDATWAARGLSAVGQAPGHSSRLVRRRRIV